MALANDLYTPPADEVKRAKRILKEMKASQKAGAGAVRPKARSMSQRRRTGSPRTCPALRDSAASMFLYLPVRVTRREGRVPGGMDPQEALEIQPPPQGLRDP